MTGEYAAVTFHGVVAPMWATSAGLASVLRQEADEDPRLHVTMWNTERDQALLRAAADRIEALTDLITTMWLYIDDRYATRKMTTPQRTLFADLIDESTAEHGSTYDRWWLPEAGHFGRTEGSDA